MSPRKRTTFKGANKSPLVGASPARPPPPPGSLLRSRPPKSAQEAIINPFDIGSSPPLSSSLPATARFPTSSQVSAFESMPEVTVRAPSVPTTPVLSTPDLSASALPSSGNPPSLAPVTPAYAIGTTRFDAKPRPAAVGHRLPKDMNLTALLNEMEQMDFGGEEDSTKSIEETGMTDKSASASTLALPENPIRSLPFECASYTS